MNSELEDQLELNSALQRELRMIKERNNIMKDTIDEQQFEVAALNEAVKKTISENFQGTFHDAKNQYSGELSPQGRLESMGADIKTLKAKMQETVQKLRNDLECE